MRIVSIAAPGNGSGKTHVLTACLRAHPGRFAAVKFTTVFRDGANCPRTATACACRSLHGRFTVVTDASVLGMPDTDTGRLTGAGARRVLWCLARPDAHAEAWGHIRQDLIPGEELVLTEGNTAIPVLKPDLLIFVASPAVDRGRWKPDAEKLIRDADHVIVNPHGGDEAAASALADALGRHRGGVRPPIVDVSQPMASWEAPALRRALDRIAGAGIADG